MTPHTTIHIHQHGSAPPAPPGDQKSTPGQQVHELVRSLPMDKLLMETDAPYFSPPGVAGQRLMPRLLRHVIAQVAAIRGQMQYEILRHNRRNAEDTYGICLDWQH